MCRKCYINPIVVDAFLAGELRHRQATRSGGERVHLLQVLARTPEGVGFARSRAPSSRRSKRLCKKSLKTEKGNRHGRRNRTVT